MQRVFAHHLFGRGVAERAQVDPLEHRLALPQHDRRYGIMKFSMISLSVWNVAEDAVNCGLLCKSSTDNALHGGPLTKALRI